MIALLSPSTVYVMLMNIYFRGSRDSVNLDVENELREAMSDTTKEEGKSEKTKTWLYLKLPLSTTASFEASS